MSGFSDAIGRGIIARHFPEADPAKVEWHAAWLSPPLVTRLPPLRFIKAGDDHLANVEVFQRSIRAAWEAYSSLPLHVRQGDGLDWVAFARIVRRVTGSAIIPGEQAGKSEAIERMKQNLAEAEKVSAQAMRADHPAKVALVEHARSAWIDFTGTEPPVKTSGGAPFLEFVADLIRGAEKNWGAEKALAAWRTATAKKRI